LIRNLIKFVVCKIILIFLTLSFSTCFAKENLSLYHDNLIINLEGHFIQGGLVKGRTNKNITIKFKDKILRKTSNGEFVIGFGRDHPTNGYLILNINNELIKKSFKIKKRIYKTQKINGLRKKMVTPPKSFYERIIRENKSIKEVRGLNSNLDFVFQKFNWPAKGIISGVFGSQRILNGKPKRPHYGIDIAAKKGTKVVAPTESIVRMAEKDLYYTGGTIMLDHGHGITSVYSHLSSINVKVGDKVLKNQKIGEVGSTGRSTGPHLDWRVNWFDQRLDPLMLLENK
jgi:murein DD-endopeptidase MepM/ murein hydrolase activator NlpD